MKKRDTFNFLVKTNHVKYDRMTGQSHDDVTYDIRKFKLVRTLAPISEEEKRAMKLKGWLPSADDVFLEIDDLLNDEVTTGDEYAPVDDRCPKELRFKSRSAAILKASILGLGDLYEFKKSKIPHPLTFAAVKKFARRAH